VSFVAFVVKPFAVAVSRRPENSLFFVLFVPFVLELFAVAVADG